MTLLPDEAHLWAFDLRTCDGPCNVSALEPFELGRAARLAFETDRIRFVRARVLVRTLLSNYLAVGPECIRLESGAFGKPAVAFPVKPPIQFNTSRSGCLLVVAVGCSVPLGIDAEFVCETGQAPDIARGQFTAREAADLNTIPLDRRAGAIARHWTRREACLKALGTGLSLHPRSLGWSDDPACGDGWQRAGDSGLVVCTMQPIHGCFVSLAASEPLRPTWMQTPDHWDSPIAPHALATAAK